jgi:Tfp pilus assembly protein PilO
MLVILTVVLLLFAGFRVVSKQIQEFQELKCVLAVETAKIKQVETKAAELPQLVAVSEKVQVQHQQVMQEMCVNLEDGTLYVMLDSCLNSQVQLLEVSRGKVRQENDWVILPLHLRLTGTYNGLTLFIDKLECLPVLVTITVLEISKATLDREENQKTVAAAAVSPNSLTVAPPVFNAPLVVELEVYARGLGSAPVKVWPSTVALGHLDAFAPAPGSGLSLPKPETAIQATVPETAKNAVVPEEAAVAGTKKPELSVKSTVPAVPEVQKTAIGQDESTPTRYKFPVK